jgi:hypothetical protein
MNGLNKIGFVLWLGLFFLMLGADGVAQIRWDARQLEFKPKLRDKAVVAAFTFTNAGNDTVTVKEWKTSCGCTTAVLEKRVYRPGESGSISVTFTFENRSGLEHKSIVVVTDDPVEPVVTLSVVADIPQVVRLSPFVVRWAVGEAAEEKVIYVKVVHTEPVRILKVVSNHKKLRAKLRTLQEGSEYEIVVKPTDTREPAKAVLRLLIDLDQEKLIQAYADIESSGG